MTANYLVCNIEVTKKRGKSKRKVYFSFLFRVPVTSTVTNRLGSLHVRCPGVCKCRLGEVANIGSLCLTNPCTLPSQDAPTGTYQYHKKPIKHPILPQNS